ncbi:hypothetical protein C8R44DRAFT_976099 [Mycena epipterygia]|nr:hypothetical protein C8R44DRAFT_976099 [Mycena epipterygia]
MPPARLGQELLDSIVDKVQERRTLKACSLVAKSFVLQSQKRLFRSVCLYNYFLASNHPKGTDCLTVVMPFQRALDLFTTSPHLITHVKGLYLGLRVLQDCGAAESEQLKSVHPPLNRDHSRGLEHLTIGVATRDYNETPIGLDMHSQLTGLRKLSLLNVRATNDANDAHFTRFILKSGFGPTLEHLELAFAWDGPPQPSFVSRP